MSMMMYVFLHFDANGGSGTVPDYITTTSGGTLTIPSSSLTRAGYTFDGWNTASDGSGTAYAPGSTITIYNDVTLYAQWKKSSVFDISSDGNCVAFFGTAIDGLTSPKLIINGELAFDTETSAAAARANLGLTGAETKTLLWENARPTSVFGEQDIGVSNIDNFDFIEVFYRFNINENNNASTKVISGNTISLQYGWGSSQNWERKITVNSNTSLHFESAVIQTVREDNAYIIPLKIYGIKEV